MVAPSISRRVPALWVKPYRYYRQRRNTVMVRAPKWFLDQVLWPEFSELDQALQAYLHQVTLRVIR